MTSEQLQDYCKNTAIQIWRDYAGDHADLPGAALMPLMLGDYLIGADLLIVGMNPSYSEKTIRKILNVSDEFDVNSLFAWDETLVAQAMERRVNELIHFEREARAKYEHYFGPLNAFAKRVGAHSLDHIDMFLLRHTSQKEFQAAYGKTFNTLMSFATKQFELFSHTLKIMAPKVVVIANAAASNFALSGLGLKSSDGGRSYRWTELPGVPFFLSGMLSGQRALDTYSRTRLELDVKAAVRLPTR